jgi:DNA-binding NarL/FixJ family response regulator
VRIFIVEDEIVIVRGLEEALTGFGYTVCGFASSGEEALERIDKEEPHLALVDIFLRGKMDGIELANLITSRFGIPVIYITAYSNKKVLARAKLSDPFGYIVKPIRDSQLKVSLELAIQRIKDERKRTRATASYLKTIEELEDQLKGRTDELEAAFRKLELTEHELEGQKSKLDELRKELQDLNGTLLTLTKQMERTREDVELELKAAIRSRILPILKALELDPSFEKCKTELEMLFLYMNQLSSSLSEESPWCMAFSTTELRVATLIKRGFSSEEIARQLYLSLETVKTHRKSIRKKLDIQNTRTNLYNYLKAK